MVTHRSAKAWPPRLEGRAPLPLPIAVLLLPVIVAWTLPQTLAGVAIALLRLGEGYRPSLCRFGPFLFVVIRARGPLSAGISLGVVVFAQTHEILKHELCHLITGLWLSWSYLAVYGLEYLLAGHDRSPHERVTCWLERRLTWGWSVVGGWSS